VDAPRAGVDLFGACRCTSIQLREGAYYQDALGQGVPQRELGQHVSSLGLPRRGLLLHRQLLPLEQDLWICLAAEVERLSRAS